MKWGEEEMKPYLEIFHTGRVDDGVEEGLEDDEAVDHDAGADDVVVGHILQLQNAVFAVDDEPNDGRHPAHDERAHDQQRRDDGLR